MLFRILLFLNFLTLVSVNLYGKEFFKDTLKIAIQKYCSNFITYLLIFTERYKSDTLKLITTLN